MRVPANTYRLQITADFDLFEATRRLAYLHDLGVDWVYLSPLLAAEPGSAHGYDVVDPGHIDADRGGAEGLAALSTEARRLGMGVLVDIVPNHVGVATPVANPWWWDLLREGPASEHAEIFDVDWDFGQGKVRIPVLGDDDLPVDGSPIGHLEVVTDGPEGPELRYHDNRYPIAPGTLPDGDLDPAAVHARQNYELIGWRRGDAELNYRRFFTVTTLAGVRVEVPEVFAAAHTEVRRWFEEDLVDGLRIDHPDGLRDPEGYLEHLAGLTSGGYVLVEKILEPGEELPRGWAMDGTTGYDVLALVDRVLTDPSGEGPLDALEARLRGGPVDWHVLVHDRKRSVADGSLLAETRRIVRELPDLLPAPAEVLEDAVAELLACFPVYRSYLPAGRAHLDEAFAAARERRPDLDGVLDDLIHVLGDADAPAAARFQQTSGMVMAKGVEDCSFYRTSRLTSLTEVGADPATFAVSPQDFHQAMVRRQLDWPRAMTALSTHDTKRSEDVRARIGVLAESPDLWAETMDRLQELAPMPDAGFASLVWQAAAGAWPLGRERLHAYAEKAMREAGDHTTWTDPDAAYEQAVHDAVDAAYDDPAVTAVLAHVVEQIAPAGRSNALAAKLVAITAPGVPDVYQGTELWDLSLVDPDNRRPVDFDRRATLLADGTTPDGRDDEGVAKLRVTSAALRARRDSAHLFTTYRPVGATGPAADHVLAFDRGGAITVATRLPLGLAAKGGWAETTLDLPEGRWRNVLDDRGFDHRAGGVPLADLLGGPPVALLVKRTED